MRIISNLFLIMVIIGVVIFMGCNNDDGSSSTTSSLDIQTKVGDITPEIEAASSSISSKAWGDTGDIVTEFYNLFREYRGQVDEGVISPQNFYKVLFEIDNNMANMESSLEALTNAQVIVPPFDFGNNNETYNEAINFTGTTTYANHSLARNVNGDITNALITVLTDTAAQDGYAVFEIEYNASTEDLTLDFLNAVDYDTITPAIDGFVNRTWVSGNVGTHAFQVQILVGSSAGVSLNLIGMGVSQGAGEVFLLKSVPGSTYYVIPGDATETTLETLTATAEGSLPASVTASYKPWIDAQASFTVAVDLIDNITDFNNGNAKEGTISLNY